MPTETITATQLNQIANLINMLSGPIAEALVALLAQSGYSVADVLAQTAKNLEHTDTFLKMETARVKAELAANPPEPKVVAPVVAPAVTKTIKSK